MKIPKGWRILKEGTILKAGDRCGLIAWGETGRIGELSSHMHADCYIRRVKKARNKTAALSEEKK